MIGLPPFDVGIDHEMVAKALSGVAIGLSGALGVVDGVTGFDVPVAPVPAELMATTANVYCVPFVRPVTVQLSWPVVVQVFDPGDEVTE